MNFADFVKRYWGKLRPSGAAWTYAAIAEDSGLTVEQVTSWAEWCVQQNTKAASVLPDEELISSWDKAHQVLPPSPGMVWIQTGMGGYWGFPNGKVSGMTIEEFTKLLIACIKAAK